MKHTFSCYWSESLGEAISEASREPYPIECHEGSQDFQSLERATAQGIDSHLEAIRFSEFKGGHGRRGFMIEPQSVAVLVRRLLESGEESDMTLASSICETLGIELI
jgi:hypothetical protein